jgi:hypothetical protein
MSAPLPRFVVRPALDARRRRRRTAVGTAALAIVAIVVASRLARQVPDAFGGAAFVGGRAPWSRQAPPATLAATGLYADVATKTLAPGVRSYVPQYPLWTDGARKARFVALPPGAPIDATDPDLWSFPVGTRLWKEFAFERRVETRYLTRLEDGWLAATYVWDVAEREAVLAPARGVRAAAFSRPGVPYDVPGRADCRACHDVRATPVLGVSALQLSPDRDPLAPHAEPRRPGDLDLDALVREGLVVGQGDAWRTPPRIDAPTPRARAALGYLHANCGACHTTTGPLAALDLVLDARAHDGAGLASPVASVVGRGSKVRVPTADGAADVRVVPGLPEASVLWRRMASRDPRLQMPPLGTRVVDDEGVALLEAFIREDLAPSAPVRPRVSVTPVKEEIR